MLRRLIKNKTGIKRLASVGSSTLWIAFVCIRCGQQTRLPLDSSEIINTDYALKNEAWSCTTCGFVHANGVELPLINLEGEGLPYKSWNAEYRTQGSVGLERFWRAFFRTSVESKDSYWKQCNTCSRVLPAASFDRHAGWGPLEKQLECRPCKAVINAQLNPKRTKQQLHESASRRRIADLLTEGYNEQISHEDLFKRFNSRCFKTGRPLSIDKRDEWHIDHTLPSKYLYPLTEQNATLLSREANAAKAQKWPSQFYTNKELVKLARITGQNIELMALDTPIINPVIDVDAAVSRVLNVRNKSDLSKRINELKMLIESNSLQDQLSDKNKKMLGY